MINFLKTHADEKPSMKSIIDYEIAKKLNKREFYIPVFYASGDRFLASADELLFNNYKKIASNILNNSIKYIQEQGISYSKITIEEIYEEYRGPRGSYNKNIFAYKVKF